MIQIIHIHSDPMHCMLYGLLAIGLCLPCAVITEITDQNLERILQDGDPWVIQFGSFADPTVQQAHESLQKLEAVMSGLLNIGFYKIKDAASLKLASMLNLPSLRDVYFFNTKHNITETPENTWVFALPVARPVRFNIDANTPTEENLTAWVAENTPSRTVNLSTMCLEQCVAFPENTQAVASMSGNSVIFAQHPTPRLMLLAAKYRHVAAFASLGNSTSLRNALPGGPTMPADTACVVVGPDIQPPKVFTGEADTWLSACEDILRSFPARTAPAKEINRRRRIATMASLQNNITEIGDAEAFHRYAKPPLNMGGLAIAFFTPSMEEQHARYIKHFGALATKYMALASDNKHMPMRFFHINAEAHPGIARHMGVEKIPSLVCALPASEERMARTYHDGKFETEPMFRFMRDTMMTDQNRMREYTPPSAEELPDKFSSSAHKSYPVEMPKCPPCDVAVLRNGLFYPAKNAPHAEIHIDTSQSKKYLDVEAEKERQRKKKEARAARMKNRSQGKKNEKTDEL